MITLFNTYLGITNTNFITMKQYIAIVKYMYTGINFIYPIKSNKDECGFTTQRLIGHRYFANEIIQLFGKDTAKEFKNKWKDELGKVTEDDIKVKPGYMYGLSDRRDHEIYYITQNGAEQLIQSISEQLSWNDKS